MLIPLYFLLITIIGEIHQLLLNQASIIASIQSGSQALNVYLLRLNIPNDGLQATIHQRLTDIGSKPSTLQAGLF